MADTPRKRIIRKPSLLSTVRSMPLDVLMLIGEWWSSFDMLSWFAKSSYLAGLLLNIAFLSIKLYYEGVLEDEEDLVMDWFEDNNSYLLPTITVLLAMFSTVNTVYLCTTFKKFILFKQPTEPRFIGDDQWKIRSRNARIEEVDVGREDGKKESRWVLRVWSPPDGSLILFSLFSPPHVAIIYGTNGFNWVYYVPVAFFTSLTLYTIMALFRDRIADEQILGGQVLFEFTENIKSDLVHKKHV